MPPASARCPKRFYPAFDQRCGLVAVSLLLVLVVVIGVGSLALNLTWLTSHQVELREASEAAALAGAAELFDPTPAATGSVSDLAAAARVVAATAKARSFFSANSPAILRTTGTDPDVVAGWCESPTTPEAQFNRWTGVGSVNAISVRGIRRRSNGQAVVLWFGNLFGVGNAEPAAAAMASMDQRIYGFRPQAILSVPMVPLLVPSTVPWPSGGPGTAAGLPDNYSVDPRTGAVTSGPDGVAEITLLAPLAGATPPEEGDTVPTWLSLPNEATNYTLLAQQVSGGLDASDLVAIGGEFALELDGTLWLLAAAPPSATQSDALLTALQTIRGKKRVWPVGSLAGNNTGVLCQVTDFVAGCVVDGSRDSNYLTIVIQACTIQTNTGLLRGGTARNPWIGKLILNE